MKKEFEFFLELANRPGQAASSALPATTVSVRRLAPFKSRSFNFRPSMLHFSKLNLHLFFTHELAYRVTGRNLTISYHFDIEGESN